MPQVSNAQLLKTLSQRPAGAAVFLAGEEEHLREAALAKVVEIFLDPATRDFNFDQLRGTDAGAEELASLLSTPPMMAEHRVVVLREAQGLSNRAREVVEQVAQRCPPGLVLIVTATIPPQSKAKFYETLKKAALSAEYNPIDALDLPGWLLERAQEEHGLEIELEAARALAAAIGGQLGVLASELEKLASYVGERRRITVDDVRAVGGYVPQVERWAWFDLVVERRLPEALRQLPLLLESGETGVGLVMGIAGQLLRVGLALAGGATALERELPPRQRWLARRVVQQARAWSPEAVDGALAELLRTDRMLKNTALSDRQAIEELLLRLAGLDERRRGAA